MSNIFPNRNEEYLERPLPSDIEAEDCIIGAVLLDNEAIDQAKLLDPEDFYNPMSRKVWEAMRSLRDGGISIDPITIAAEMRRIWPSVKDGISVVDSIGGMNRIAQYAMGLPHHLNVAEYVEIVKSHSLRRSVVRIANTLTRDALAQDVPAQELLDHAEAKLLALNTKAGREHPSQAHGFTSGADIVPDLADQFERYHNGEVTGVATGMEPLDDVLDGGGLQRKGLYVIGGREKSGKTSLVLDWVHNITVEQGMVVPYITCEMSKQTLMKRLYSMHTGIPFFMFRPGFRDTDHNPVYTRAMEGLKDFKQYPFRISDTMFNLQDIIRYCTRAVEQSRKEGQLEVAALVIDYLQIIIGPSGGGRTEEVTKISRALKQLASELDVPVIVLSNLNRKKFGDDDDARPDVDSLRESGTIGYDAEAVMFVHNPAYKPGKPYTPREVTDMTLILSRQRNGPTKDIPLKFIGPYMSFMTEEKFNKSFGHPKQELPTAKGQTFVHEQHMQNLWDENDDDWNN